MAATKTPKIVGSLGAILVVIGSALSTLAGVEPGQFIGVGITAAGVITGLWGLFKS